MRFFHRYAAIVVITAAVLNMTGCAFWRDLKGEKQPATRIVPASLFQDNMVLQRDMPLTVWGWCEPDHAVTVTLRGEEYTAVANHNGRWTARLKPQPAGGPVIMTISGVQTIALKNVMIGEVWLCAGQSNMQFPLRSCSDGAAAIKQAVNSGIRLFQVKRISTPAPQLQCGGTWRECSPETAAGFSGVGYYFGRELFHDLHVAVGLIEVSWGGTAIEAWLPWSLQAADPEYAVNLEPWKRLVTASQRTPLEETYRRALARWQKLDKSHPGPQYHVDAGNRGYGRGWALTMDDLSGWRDIKLPTVMENYFGDIDGAVWFRREVMIPPEWARQSLRLELGPIDDSDETYFNGKAVGETGITASLADTRTIPRVYRIPGQCVNAGRNLLAVRVFDRRGAGGFTGRPDQLKIARFNQPQPAIGLAGFWQARVETALDPFSLDHHAKPQPPPGPGDRNWPSGIRNGMIAPLIPYSLRGVIWYQGEANTGNPKLYRRQLPDLVRDWRQAWGEDFYFLVVQLPNYGRQWPAPQESSWAELRAAQAALSTILPRTGYVVTIDLGEADNIHPAAKKPVGQRLARLALDLVYGKKLVARSPEFAAMTVRNGKAVIRFNHVGSGLTAKGSPTLHHFAVAGKDGYFYWARAEIIDKDTIEVWSGKVPHPVTVRYAWAFNPAGGNLYQAEGLPAAPFQAGLPAPVKP
ncbi:MAG: sialate O-acetylesterase [Victivallales bacterium]|nr:sialate O-acetylesterase [Victivallales bacterium]